MKKLISFILFLTLVLSLCLPAAATTVTSNGDYAVSVLSSGTGTEQYSVTVPETLTPGGAAGTVKLTGTWASSRTVSVSAPTTLTLANTANAGETKTVGVNFDGITQAGNDLTSISVSKSVSVANFAAGQAPLFGTWTGILYYTVGATGSGGAEPEPTLITFTAWDLFTYQAEAGMTWAQWCDSDYNPGDFYCSGDYVLVSYGNDEYLTAGKEGSISVSPSDQIISGNNYWSNWFGDFEG